MSELAVEVRGLRKAYGPVEAVRGIDLSVPKGVVYALIGPNGAGKTTTLEILEGHRKPTAGEARVLGFDPTRGEMAFKQRIGIVLQSSSIPFYLRAEEAVAMFGGYYPHPRPVDEVLRLVGLVLDPHEDGEPQLVLAERRVVCRDVLDEGLVLGDRHRA